jgi:hypothetical protein
MQGILLCRYALLPPASRQIDGSAFRRQINKHEKLRGNGFPLDCLLLPSGVIRESFSRGRQNIYTRKALHFHCRYMEPIKLWQKAKQVPLVWTGRSRQYASTLWAFEKVPL